MKRFFSFTAEYGAFETFDTEERAQANIEASLDAVIDGCDECPDGVEDWCWGELRGFVDYGEVVPLAPVDSEIKHLQAEVERLRAEAAQLRADRAVLLSVAVVAFGTEVLPADPEERRRAMGMLLGYASHQPAGALAPDGIHEIFVRAAAEAPPEGEVNDETR